MASLINVGVSGLNAAMAGLTTAGHNISNASTPGYTRQEIVQTSQNAIYSGGGFFGQGTQVANIQRIYSQFLSTQVANGQSRQQELSAYNGQVTQIDNLLADSTAGLSPSLQTFFTGVQGLATNPGSNPSSAPSRQTLLSDAQSLVSRFQSLDQMLSGMRENTNGQIKSAVSLVTSYAQQIAILNGQISRVESVSIGQSANDLHDQRDQLVSELGKQIGVSTTANNDGSINVFIGSGMPVVMGSQYYGMGAANSETDPSRLSISLTSPNGTTFVVPDEQLSGGTLGGLVSFMNETLDTAENKLGQVAVALAQTFNAQHRLGQDLYGNVGQDFFNVGRPSVVANATNSGISSTGVMSVSYDGANVASLTASDYQVTFDGSAFNVMRLSDKTLVGGFSAVSPSLSVDGLTFDYTPASGAATAGDSFLVQPTRRAASAISVAITDTNMIAAGALTRTAADISNVGKGSISKGTLTNSTNLSSLFPASPAVTTVSYTGSNLNFSGLPASAAIQVTHANGTVTQYAAGTTSVAFVPGETVALATSFTNNPSGDYSFSISGQVLAGDKFTLSRNAGATSDNSNALALGQLQTTNILNNGKATYQAAYAQLVGVVGNTARDVSVNLTAQTSLVTQLQTSQQSVSGVNLDEEAANLIRYQQAYQAAGKLIQVSSTLFNQLLNT